MQHGDRTKEQLDGELTAVRDPVSEGAPRDGSSASEEQYRDLYENAPDMMVSVDPATATIVQCNRTTLTKLGYSREEMIGRSIFDLYHPDCLEDVAKAFQAFKRTGEVCEALLQVTCKDGEKIDVSLSASAVRDADGTIVRSRSVWRDVTDSRRAERELRKTKGELERRIAERTEKLLEVNEKLASEITERKEAQEALRHAQKIEALGQLTSGLAHDFNNLLTVIQTNATLIADDLPPDATQTRSELRDVQDAARHGATLVEKLLSFSRKGMLSLKPLDLAGRVERLSDTLRRLLPASIEIQSSIEDRPLRIEADPDAIEQIVMNLANNARDAMPNGGILRIDVRRASLDEERCRRQGWGTAGKYVRLSVSDSGDGMDEATKEKIFEPFFTTKAAGEGTGLGMTIIFGLMKQQKGFVDVESAVGRGTTISVYFPLTSQEPEPVTPPQAEEKPPRGEGETILLIEDEEALRRAGKRVLERYGYSVLLGVDGEDGFRVFKGNSSRIVLVITDIVMPKMSGPEVHDMIRKETPDVRFIYTSGYSANDIHSGVPLDPTVPFVSKPWALSALVALVREVLDEVPSR